jgi:hypothetical protein
VVPERVVELAPDAKETTTGSLMVRVKLSEPEPPTTWTVYNPLMGKAICQDRSLLAVLSNILPFGSKTPRVTSLLGESMIRVMG